METLKIDYRKLIAECRERAEKDKARADKADYFYHMKCAQAIENLWKRTLMVSSYIGGVEYARRKASHYCSWRIIR